MGTCHYCGPTDEELRPYGPGGSTVCFGCATATPEREAATEATFGALLGAASAMGVPVIGSPDGPMIYTPLED